jgi:phage terminase small subunit
MPKKMPRKSSRPNRRDIERYSRFAKAYLDLSHPETYLKADRSAVEAGYSKSYAFHRAYELLGRVGVQKEIKRIRDNQLKSSTVATPDEILENLTAQLRVLPNRLIDKETKEFIPLDELPDEVVQAIAGVEIIERIIPGGGDAPVRERKTKYKLVCRLSAAIQIGKWYGLWTKDAQKAPVVTQMLVNFPSRELSLEEWQTAALAILRKQDEAKAIP